MPAGAESLHLLVGDFAPCPICDELDCSHEWYGKEHYRVGDPRDKHPIIARRHIPAPRRIYSDAGQLLFAKGNLMTADEAAAHGVPIPGQAGPGHEKGRRRQRPSTEQGPKGPTEDRARKPGENREAGDDDPHPHVLPAHHGRHDNP